jgi:uncharacterized protein (TIGR03435 family)
MPALGQFMNAQMFVYFGLAVVAFSGLRLYSQPASQDNPAKSVFEVASVKRSVPQSSGNCKITPMRLSCTNYRLDQIVYWAYKLTPSAVQGMPSWTAAAPYDINASSERETLATLSQAENHKLVIAGLQDLLVNRFHLTFHYEKQLRPGFRLVAKKGGLAIKPVANPKGGSSHSSSIVDGQRVIKFRNYTMANVADALTGELARPIVDATGIDGRYDFTVQIPLNDTGVTIFNALGDFGLKLEAEKIETNIFVIDRLEKPSDN